MGFSWLCKVLWEQFGQSCKAAAGTQPLLTLGTTTTLLLAALPIPPSSPPSFPSVAIALPLLHESRA